MSGHRKFEELSDQLRSDPERRARIEQGQQAIETGLNISRLREARGLTQENVAAQMGVTQSNVSHFERSPNVFVRTLAAFVEALGGELKITAVFSDQTVSLVIPSEMPSEVKHDVHPGLSA
jgi:transcriptional regulator with XRE-family HTH domain